MAALRDRLEAGLKAIAPAGGRSSAQAPSRLPNTTLFAVPGVKAETAVIALDLEGRRGVLGRGLLVGQGGAVPCAGGHGRAGRTDPGRDPRSAWAIRPRRAEIEAFLKAWAKLAESLYKAGKQQDIAA